MQNNETAMEIPAVEKTTTLSDHLVGHRQDPASRAANHNRADGIAKYEFIDSSELARRLAVPTTWVRDQVRTRSQDPLPHVNLGKYVRFLWGSPELEEWISRRIVKGNNRRVERVP